MAESPFGPPSRWPDDDLIGVSHAIDELLTLSAYANGVFPMPTQRGLMGWYSPVWRAVLPLDGLRVTRSLRKMLGRYEIRIDTAFDAVLAGCADPRRPNGWIDDDIRRRLSPAASSGGSCTRWRPGLTTASWPAVSTG